MAGSDLIPRLNALLRRNRWTEMHRLISDDMLAEFAVIAPPDELPYALRVNGMRGCWIEPASTFRSSRKTT